MPRFYTTPSLHAAPRTEVVRKSQGGSIEAILVRMQSSKTDIWYSLHVRPTSFGFSGLQTTDVLDYLDFQRSQCNFVNGECYAHLVDNGFELDAFLQTFGKIESSLKVAESEFAHCGIYLDRPEGVGYFSGKRSIGFHHKRDETLGDGHTASIANRLKDSEDTIFKYVFTWLEGPQGKGWTTHYHAQHPPLSTEIKAAFAFLGMKVFEACPEFDFEPCHWRTNSFQAGSYGSIDSNSASIHAQFDSHAGHFTPGLESFIEAQRLSQTVGMSILRTPFPANQFAVKQGNQSPPIGDSDDKKKPDKKKPAQASGTSATGEDPPEANKLSTFEFDVAISFAGPQRPIADALANKVRSAGYKVFYDGFYPEQLWGKDLTLYFDNIYRKDSRFCVILVSEEYAARMWTIHEHKSARARALEEKDEEYILPIRIDATDLPGLLPTIGYLSLQQMTVDEIGDILLSKLEMRK